MTEQLTHTHTHTHTRLSPSGVYLKLEPITTLLIGYTIKQDKKLKKKVTSVEGIRHGDFIGGSDGEKSACNEGDLGSILGL